MKSALILVRHCQSDWNVSNRLSGMDNTPRLTEAGRGQARSLASSLVGVGEPSHGAIFSSDLTRALETSSILSEALLLPIHVDPRFREVGLGDLDGKTREEIHQLPDGEQHLASLRENNYDFTSYRGENREAVLLRHKMGIGAAMNRLALNRAISAPDFTAIIVGHGSALRTLLNYYRPGSKLHEQGGYDLIELRD